MLSYHQLIVIGLNLFLGGFKQLHRGSPDLLRRPLFRSVLLSTLFVSLMVVTGAAQDPTRISIMEDASGLFNERGYFKSNSVRVDGEEVINDFNGNLMFSRQLYGRPLTQSGIQEELTLTYNGSVAHISCAAVDADGITGRGETHLNAPEWILGYNGVAVQAFNFENDLLSWSTRDSLGDPSSIGDDVSLLIDGYHSCWKAISMGEDDIYYGNISLLMSDGSIQEYISLEPTFTLLMYSGEYRTYSKEDGSRGYLNLRDTVGIRQDCWYDHEIDSIRCDTNYVVDTTFTVFFENGTTVYFDLYRPTWRTRTFNHPEQRIDSLVLFLPVRFADQQGHSVSVRYDTVLSDGSPIWGRPLVAAAGLYFDWGVRRGTESVSLTISDGENTRYTVYHSVASATLDRNRSKVTRLVDAMGRTTEFEYGLYQRFADNIADNWQYCIDSCSWSREIGRDLYLTNLYRLSRIKYPDGGLSYFNYYIHGQPDWPIAWHRDTLSVNFDRSLLCFETSEDPIFPCKKSVGWDSTGRDPYFTNMVSVRQHKTADGIDTTVVSTERIIYEFDNVDPKYQIDTEDILRTIRTFNRDGEASAPDSSRVTELVYSYFPEPGIYSTRARDRGWVIKLLEKKERNWYEGPPQRYERRFWDIWSCDQFCSGTFLLDSVLTTQDNVTAVQRYGTVFNGNWRDDSISTIKQRAEVDPWGNLTVTFFSTDWDSIGRYSTPWDSVPRRWPYYSTTQVDSFRVYQPVQPMVLPHRDSTTLPSDQYLIGREVRRYYNISSTEGYVGQCSSATRYVLQDGVAVDSLVESFSYLTGADAERRWLSGNLRQKVSPAGDSVHFYYHERCAAPPGWCKPIDSVTNPLLYTELRRDGTEAIGCLQASGGSPFWYRRSQFLDRDGTTDSLVDWQVVRDEGQLTHAVEANGYLSAVSYDYLNRVTKVVLPYSFGPDGYWAYRPDSVTCSPVLDGEAYYRLDCCYMVGYCGNSTVNVASNPADGGLPPDDTTWGLYLNFGTLDLSGMHGIDSAFLYVHCLSASADAPLAIYSFDPPLADCQSNTLHPHNMREDSTRMAVGPLRFNVTSEVAWWLSAGEAAAHALSVEPPRPRRGSSFYGTVATAESAVPAQRPYLKIYYSTQGGNDPETFSLRLDYDDVPAADGSPVGVSIRTRSDSVSFIRTATTWFDGFGRGFQHDALTSVDTTSTFTEYDWADRSASTTDQLGYVTRRTYDALNRTRATIYPDDSASQRMQTYSSDDTTGWGFPPDFDFRDPQLLLSVSTDENGHQVRSYSDIRGKLRLEIRRDPVDTTHDLKTYFDYDLWGNLRTVIRPNGDSVHYVYNSIGQLLQEWSADYSYIYYEYDKNGNVTAVSDANARRVPYSDGMRWRYSRYDRLNRVVEAGEMEDNFWTGARAYVPKRRFSYDQLNCTHSEGRLSLQYSAESGFQYGERYDYDARGRIIRQVNVFNAVLDSSVANQRYQWSLTGDSLVTEFEYNWADQVVAIQYPGSLKVVYRYDDLGRLLSVGTPTDSSRFWTGTYTLRNELLSTSLSHSLQTVDYTYNERGWLTAINNGTSVASAPGDLFGEKLYYYTGPAGTAGWTAQYNGNIIGQDVSLIGGTLDRYVHFYDSFDRLTSSKVRFGSQWRSHEAFQYDRNGNITQLNRGDFDERVYTYTPGTNRLAQIDRLTTFTYNHDFAGNMTYLGDRQASLFWDYMGRLDSVSMPSGVPTETNLVTFGYRSDGIRVYKKYKYWYRALCSGGGGGIDPDPDGLPMGFDGQTDSLGLEFDQLNSTEGLDGGVGDSCTFSRTYETYYLRSRGKLLAEYPHPDSLPAFRYVYAGDQRIAMYDKYGRLHFYLNDHLGSSRVVLDSAGTVKDRYEYYSYGDNLDRSLSTGQSHQYTGQELDMDGGLQVYYYGARYYDDNLGVFLSIDPLRQEYPAWSPYVYTLDNPMKYTDPTGECVGLLAILAGAAYFVLATPETAQTPTEEGDIHQPTLGEKVVQTGLALLGTSAVISWTNNITRIGAPTSESASAGTGANAEGAAAAEGSAAGRGVANPKVAERVRIGNEQHARLTSTATDKGWTTNPVLKDPLTGKTVKPDVVSPSNRPIELKPNTPTGRKRGQAQLEAYERACGKKGRVVYYDPEAPL